MQTREQLLEIYRFVQYAHRRHWKKGVIVFAVGAMLALVGTLLMPRSYYSEARLFVRFGRENQVDPTATGPQMVSLYESRESEINSLIEILKSRAILDRVVAELGPGFVLHGSDQKQESGTGERGKATEAGGQGSGAGSQESETGGHVAAAPSQLPTKEHQAAVTRLTKDIAIYAPRKSNIITVSCRATSPAIAQKIVAKLVDVYQDEHVRVHRSAGSYEFFQQQAKQSLAAWQSAAAELREMKNRLGIVTIEGRRKNLEDQIADLDSKQLANQADLKTARAKVTSLEALIAKLPESLVTQEVEGPNAAFDGMRQALYMLEAQEQELAAKMHEDHPRLAAVRQQVRDLKHILETQPTNKIQATEALNPARQGLEGALLAEKSQVDALAARERSLTTSQEKLRGELTELNAKAGAIDELQQRVTLAEANHKEYAQRLEQSRINRNLDDERISSLSLVQPASYVSAASGPRRVLVLALGLFVAGISGFGTMIVAAWVNPLIIGGEQLADALDLPLIGLIPRGSIAAAA